MPQSFIQQQQNWMTSFQSLSVQLLAIADQATAKTNAYASQTFGTGGANAITDATAEAVIPQATAAQVASAEAGMVAILATIVANRDLLEVIRP